MWKMKEKQFAIGILHNKTFLQNVDSFICTLRLQFQSLHFGASLRADLSMVSGLRCTGTDGIKIPHQICDFDLASNHNSLLIIPVYKITDVHGNTVFTYFYSR